MSTSKNIHRTIIEVEVFSEGPLDTTDLAGIAYEIDEGDCIGNVTVTRNEVVNDDTIVVHMLRIGNDGSFFAGLDD